MLRTKHHHSCYSHGQTWWIWILSSGTSAQSRPNFHLCVHGRHILLHISHPRRTSRILASGNGATSSARLWHLRRLRHWTSWIQAPNDSAQSSRFLLHPLPPFSWRSGSRSRSLHMSTPRAAEWALSSTTWGESNFTLSLGRRDLRKPNFELARQLAKTALPSRLTKASNYEVIMSKENDGLQVSKKQNDCRNLRNSSRFFGCPRVNVQRFCLKVLT